MKHRYLISSIIIIVLFLSLSLSAWLKADTDFSYSERRPLEKMPPLTLETVLSGDFTGKFEGYSTDQFPWRDKWRTLKAIAKFYIFNQKDNNDIFIHDGYASKLETEINGTLLDNAETKLNYLYNTYVKDKAGRVFFSVIPDKSATLADKGGYPSLDYNEIAEDMKGRFDWAEYIDIYPLLDYTDYYKTDTHWRQEMIVDVAEKLASAMGATVEKDFEEITLDQDFYGVYYGQSSLPLPPDKITYLTSSVIENAVVYNYEELVSNPTLTKPSATGVYDMAKLDSKDPYEMFLSGASFLVRIENPACDSGRRLIIFRDSYASSIAPLLLESYSEVILIDTRYVMPHFVGNFVTKADFEGADVLFLYSAMLLNSSSTLR